MNVIKLSDYIKKELICLDLQGNTKDEVLRELSNLFCNSGNVLNCDEVHKALLERESIGSTGIGKGVAIPHAKTEAVSGLTVAFALSKKKIKYESLDDEDVDMFFVFASPFKDSQIYLKVLARISRLIREDEFRAKLLKCKTPEEILEVIAVEEGA